MNVKIGVPNIDIGVRNAGIGVQSPEIQALPQVVPEIFYLNVLFFLPFV
jgi:hypothetical protein